MEVFTELVGNVLASVILLGFGFLFGKYRERRLQQGRNLEEYDFYPFDVDEDKTLFLDLQRFSDGVSHLLRHRDPAAQPVQPCQGAGPPAEQRHRPQRRCARNQPGA
jgi:hypothetical protein